MTDTFPEKFVEALVESIGISKADSEKAKDILKSMGKGAYDEVAKRLSSFKQKYYVDPILAATKFLQKDELAFVAETFVNMVSFRKKVTLEDETVGGPIDVAVISKGDGLVWIKRKHYFDSSLNHHFFTKYFGSERIQ